MAETNTISPAQAPRFAPRRTGSRIRSITALMFREMQATYGRSPGGYVWSLVEPLGMIILLAYGFSLLLRNPSLGESFLVFYATGILPYNMYGQIQQKASMALNYSRNLLVYPVVTWIDAIAARVLLNLLTSLLVSTLLLSSMLILIDVQVELRFGNILLAYLIAASLGAGVGMVNCVITAFFPIWQTLWNILNRPLFLASGVLYIYEELPQMAQVVLWYNPLLHVTALARAGFYSSYDATFVSLVYIGGLIFGLLFFGLLLVRRFNGKVLRR